MSWITAASILCAIVSNVTASVLLKRFALTLNEEHQTLASGGNWLIAGMALTAYALAFAAYAFALRSLPVSKAYAVITFGTQAILILAGTVFFGERIGLPAWVGFGLVVLGLTLISRSAGA